MHHKDQETKIKELMKPALGIKRQIVLLKSRRKVTDDGGEKTQVNRQFIALKGKE